MSMQPGEYSISGLSAELGVTRRKLARVLADVAPVRVDGRAKYYRLADAVAALAGDDQERSPLEAGRTRLTHAQADHEELKVAVLRGSLIPAEDVERVWSGHIGNCRARLLAIPSILGALIDEDTRSAITDRIHDLLDELKEYTPDDYRSPGFAGDEDSGDGLGSSTADDGERVGRRKPRAKQRGV